MQRHTLHRSLGIASGVVIGAVALAGCSAPSSDEASDTIVVSTFPFGVEQFQEAIVDPFTEATGIQVEVETGSNSDRLSQLELSAGDPGVDVMLLSDTYVALGQDSDLFEWIDAEDVPTIDDVTELVPEGAYAGPAYTYQLNGTLYDTEALSAEEAADWSLYGDPGLAGRVALPDISASSGQLLVAGVGSTYGDGPYDVDAALEQLAGWAPGVLQFYTSSTEVTNLLTQGEIVAANSLSGFAITLAENDDRYAFAQPASGAYMTTNHAVIPEGAPNEDAAKQFIDYLLGVEAQTAAGELVGDLPVNPDAAVPERATAVLGDVPADPIGAGYQTLDPAEVVAIRDDLVERFAREVTGG
ncbi:extracellular solute-binding protein [Microbacterium marinilacus]|uniref:Extracellular solute-binding protein n=1 Tax=Microbacterium marinilacus TaxID=415209 RepID=A0ABP7BW82_9MICO|nr:extracellular solute-binding protein [Microbacterium marinilacus]MBY0688188.1 extracellular solute-binding protein [Microbacterium marinilacus]